MRVNPEGRYLVAWTRAFHRDQPLALDVVRGRELPRMMASGWLFIAEDPEPDRAIRPVSTEEDGA